MTAVVCRLVDGLLLSVGEPGDALTRAIAEDRFELNERDFIASTVRPGRHVLDIGAHLGAHTLRLAALTAPDGTVTAIEPCRRHLVLLTESLALNHFERRVTVVHAAACDVAGVRELIVSAPGLATCNAWLRPSGYAESGASYDRVPTVRVDDLVMPRPISFIKLDAEGAEGLILSGARALLAHDRPVMLVDLHPHLLPLVSGTTPRQVIDEMAGLGYRCRLLGAGVEGALIDDLPSSAVTPVVFRQPVIGGAHPAGVL